MGLPRSPRNFVWIVILALALLSLSYYAANAQAGTQDQTELGTRLYAENCAVCHGATGEGRVGATLAKNWPSIRPDLTVETIIANGVPGSPMPAWSQDNGGPLSAEEIDALTNYILSWQTGGPPEISEAPPATSRPPITPLPEVEGDPNQGAVLYDQNCVVCHGLEAEGRVGASLAKNWPSIRPDLSIKTTIANGISGTAMPAWSQENGGPLSEEQINDLVAFLLTLEPAGTGPGGESDGETEELTPFGAWMRSWGGVLVFIVLLGLILTAAIAFQRRE
jgi:mono/diheme cytochrome c family protein